MSKQTMARTFPVFVATVCALLAATPAGAQNFALDFNNNRVDIPYIGTGVDFGEISLEAWLFWRGHIGSEGVSGIIEGRGSTLHWQINSNNNVRWRLEGLDTNAAAGVQPNEWFHLAGTYSRSTREMRLYKNGVVFHTASGDSGTNNFWTSGDAQFGTSNRSSDRPWNGLIDELRIWNTVRTDTEIRENMSHELLGTEEGLIAYWKLNEGQGTTAFDSGPNHHDGTIIGATWTTDAAPVTPLGFAYGPTPDQGAVDVPRNTALTWTPGQDTQTHNVYFGADPATIEAADATNPQGVLVEQGQTDATYLPAAPLEYGGTYYWRVDEVAPDSTLFRGSIWSLTVEPYAYPIPNVTATASSSQPDMGPEKTIDGSGLTEERHSIEPTAMWLSAGTPPNWIQYEFDRTYKLHEMRVWNSNQLLEGFLGFGAKSVTVEVSMDGATWTAVDDVPEFARAPGAADYEANTTVELGDVSAKYVRLTINSTWGGMSAAGLSEVQFFYVPVQARGPQPASGATGIGINAGLNWRPGREAASHTVYFDADREAVVNETASAQTVSEDSYDPGPLDFGRTYYWKVDEVNDVTYAGEVWSFTTEEYAVVDDFESYTDDEGNRIYEAWIDGWTNGTGSVVGYLQAPFAEQTIVHGGKQAMPLEYNNVNTPYYSETERTFAPALDWSGNGADTLVVFLQGRAPSFLDNGDGSFIVGGGGTDIWNAADQFRFAAQRLVGNGAIVAKVENIVNTDPWAKVGVMIRESLTPGSKFAAVYATPGNGVRYQARLLTDAAATSDTSVATAEQMALQTPVWVKIERSGNAFSGYYSTDGAQWTAMSWNPQTINMAAASVYIGLAVTSHNANALTTGEFSDVATTGGVTGAWEVTEIGVAQPGNAADQLYVVVEDSAGKSKTVIHPDPAATTLASWQEWQIPLSDLTGVNLKAVKKLTIGVGDRANPSAGGAGRLYIDDIGFGHPAAP